jgi:hypothetical protein
MPSAAGQTIGLASGLDTNSGFYTDKDNLAVVRWRGDVRTRAVARHEIAHLALGNWLGRTPLWLNEGLAEVVERKRFQHSFASADAPARRPEQLRRRQAAGRLPGLRTFLDSRRIGAQLHGQIPTSARARSHTYSLGYAASLNPTASP